MKDNDSLPIEEAVQILSIPKEQIERWIKDGILTPLIDSTGSVRVHPRDLQLLSDQYIPSTSETRKRILIIEDDLIVSKSLKTLLEKEGFDIVVAPIGLAALDFIANQSFALVISDIRMPGMDGLKTLKAMRELESQFKKPSIPEIILTAHDDYEVKEEAQKMGIKEFILKPFDSKEFLAVLRKYLNASEVA